MKIQISDKLEIEHSDSSWVVRQRVDGKAKDGTPKSTWSNEGYYTSLENACRAVLSIKAASSNSIHRDVSSAVSELRSLWNEIHLSVTA